VIDLLTPHEGLKGLGFDALTEIFYQTVEDKFGELFNEELEKHDEKKNM
jgi:hypothetical protein